MKKDAAHGQQPNHDAVEGEASRILFTNDARESLSRRFKTEYRNANTYSTSDEIDMEAGVFLGCLEGLASFIPRHRDHVRQVEGQPRRRERVEAFANALDRVIDAAAPMDDAALAFVIFRGIQEIVDDASIEQSRRSQWQSMQAKWAGDRGLVPARDLKGAHRPEFVAFALGARKAVTELQMPLHAKRSAEEDLAVWIEEHLGRLGLPCTMTDTGLAGLAFMQTMALVDGDAALQLTAKNWLRGAITSESSWKSFFARRCQESDAT